MSKVKVKDVKVIFSLIHVIKVRISPVGVTTPDAAAAAAIAIVRDWMENERYWKGFSLVDAYPNPEIGLDLFGLGTTGCWVVRCTLVKKADDKELRPWAELLDPSPMTPWEKESQRRNEKARRAWERTGVGRAIKKGGGQILPPGSPVVVGKEFKFAMKAKRGK